MDVRDASATPIHRDPGAPLYARAISWVTAALASALPASWVGAGGGSIAAWSAGSAAAWPSNYEAAAGFAQASGDPWLFSSVKVKALDLAGLPLRAVRVDADGVELRLPPAEEPEILRLLRKPAPGVTGREFMAQLVVDLEVAGNAYVWDRGNELRRLHPASIVPSVRDRWGEVVIWRWTDALGGSVDIPDDQIVHVRGISFGGPGDPIQGTAPTAALSPGVITASKAKIMAARQAGSGTLRQVVSLPTGTQPKAIKEAKENLKSAMVSGDELIFVSGGDMDVRPIAISPKELEFSAVQEMSRDEICAVMSVPGTKSGTLKAAYGQARQENRAYYESLRSGPAALIGDAFSARPSVPPGVRIEFDFSSVESLQSGVLDRVSQAEGLTRLGVDAAAALRFVGFQELADELVADPRPAAAAAATERPTEPRRIIAAVLEANSLDKIEARRRLRWSAALADLVSVNSAVDLAEYLASRESDAIAAATLLQMDRGGPSQLHPHTRRELAVFRQEYAEEVMHMIHELQEAA